MIERRTFLRRALAALAFLVTGGRSLAHSAQWKEFVIGDWIDDKELMARPDILEQCARSMFERRMKADGFTEMRMSEMDIRWDAERRAHWVGWSAELR